MEGEHRAPLISPYGRWGKKIQGRAQPPVPEALGQTGSFQRPKGRVGAVGIRSP